MVKSHPINFSYLNITDHNSLNKEWITITDQGFTKDGSEDMEEASAV